MTAGGDVYVAGTTTDLTGPPSGFLLKYDAAGSLLWDHAWSNGVEFSGVWADAQGAYISGRSSDRPGFNDRALLLKVDSAGNEAWFKYYDPGVQEMLLQPMFTNCIADALDNVYAVGYARTWGGNRVVILAKFTGEGALYWVEQLERGDYDRAYDHSVLADGTIFITGATGNEILTVKAVDQDLDEDGLRTDTENVVGTDPADPDTDADGLLDGTEYYTHGSDPTNPDTDSDQLGDFTEVYVTFTDPADTDTDADGLDDFSETTVYDTNPTDPDTDHDGLDDHEESFPGADGYLTDPTDPDTDHDGLDDMAEYGLGTDPTDPDTDDDGLQDPAEVSHGCDPLDADTDDDGLQDGPEVHAYSTSPTTWDTDGDLLPDAYEVDHAWLDPTDPDTDHDGLDDYAELYTHGTHVADPDTDGDGLGDGDEVHAHGTDPLRADTDSDGMGDHYEVSYGLNPLSASDKYLDSDGDGLDNFYEHEHDLHPSNNDTDGDGLADGFELLTSHTGPGDEDSDGDWLKDGDEWWIHGTDPTDPDTDADGLTDWDEVTNLHTDPALADSDHDGLADGAEVHAHGTDPLKADSDGDGYPDGTEVQWGTSPLNPAWHPGMFWVIAGLIAGPLAGIVAFTKRDAIQRAWRDHKRNAQGRLQLHERLSEYEKKIPEGKRARETKWLAKAKAAWHEGDYKGATVWLSQVTTDRKAAPRTAIRCHALLAKVYALLDAPGTEEVRAQFLSPRRAVFRERHRTHLIKLSLASLLEGNVTRACKFLRRAECPPGEKLCEILAGTSTRWDDDVEPISQFVQQYRDVPGAKRLARTIQAVNTLTYYMRVEHATNQDNDSVASLVLDFGALPRVDAWEIQIHALTWNGRPLECQSKLPAIMQLDHAVEKRLLFRAGDTNLSSAGDFKVVISTDLLREMQIPARIDHAATPLHRFVTGGHGSAANRPRIPVRQAEKWAERAHDDPGDYLSPENYTRRKAIYLGKLHQNLDPIHRLGIILIDAREATIALVHDHRILEEKTRHLESRVWNKHHAGGMSQQRFERLRQAALHKFLRDVIGAANGILLKANVDHLLVGGDTLMATRLMESNLLHAQLRAVMASHTIATENRGPLGIREALQRVGDILSSLSYVRLQELFDLFMEGVRLAHGFVEYGQAEVRAAIQQGRVEVVLLAEDADPHLQRELTGLAGKYDTSVEVFPASTEWGAQFQSFEVGALLRY